LGANCVNWPNLTSIFILKIWSFGIPSNFHSRILKLSFVPNCCSLALVVLFLYCYMIPSLYFPHSKVKFPHFALVFLWYQLIFLNIFEVSRYSCAGTSISTCIHCISPTSSWCITFSQSHFILIPFVGLFLLMIFSSYSSNVDFEWLQCWYNGYTLLHNRNIDPDLGLRIFFLIFKMLFP